MVAGAVEPTDSTPVLLSDEGPWVLRSYDLSAESLKILGTEVDHLGIDEDGAQEKKYAYFHVDDPETRDRLLAAGLTLEIDQDETKRMRGILASFDGGALSIESIPGFACYRTVEETLATGAALASANPTLATWMDLGDSWEKTFPGHSGSGYDLMVLRLTSQVIEGAKPDLLVTGSVHAREYVTAEMVTRFAEFLVAGYGGDPDITWVLDHHEVHLILVANPDGRKRAETGLSWRKNANDDHCGGTNVRGIDLNRNFDFQWGCCSGSSTAPCALTFRGPSAGSEPEAMAVQTYMDGIFPDQRPDDLSTPAPLDAEGIYLDIHAFGNILLSSWAFTSSPHPNGAETLSLSRKYAFYPGYDAQLGSFGIVDGSTKDYSYGRLGVPGYTVEMGTTFFQDCPTFENTIVPGNLPALLHMAKIVRTPFLTSRGPDAVNPMLSAAAVQPGTLVTVTATLDDTRYNTASEPTQPIAAGEVYLDVPPWSGGTPLSMVPTDGNFNTTVEAAEFDLDTTGLSLGRHLVFVRGQDTAGNFGAFSAQFLDVVRDSLFTDGFESGNTSVWDATVGGP